MRRLGSTSLVFVQVHARSVIAIQTKHTSDNSRTSISGTLAIGTRWVEGDSRQFRRASRFMNRLFSRGSGSSFLIASGTSSIKSQSLRLGHNRAYERHKKKRENTNTHLKITAIICHIYHQILKSTRQVQNPLPTPLARTGSTRMPKQCVVPV